MKNNSRKYRREGLTCLENVKNQRNLHGLCFGIERGRNSPKVAVELGRIGLVWKN